MLPDNIKEKIQQYIESNFLVDLSGADFNDETNLFESGIIDSFGVIELISFIEKEFSINISNEEIMELDMCVIGITKYLNRKLKTLNSYEEMHSPHTTG